MMSNTEDTASGDFDVLDFEVHAVYGAHFTIPADKRKTWESQFNKKQRSKKAPTRTGWTPIYRNNCSAVTLDLKGPSWCSEIEVRHPKFFIDEKHNPIKMRVSRQLTIRRDGAAAITIRLVADKRDNNYDLADILAAMLLAPRTIRGINLREVSRSFDASHEMATVTPHPYEHSAGPAAKSTNATLDALAANKASPLYLLFLGAIKETVASFPCLNWCEYALSGPKFSPRQELMSWVGDEQVPYFVFFARMPEETYKAAFCERTGKSHGEELETRRHYTKYLAAILHRWLSPGNAEYVSLDYLRAANLTVNDIFANRYMNSLSFVTFSATGTVCLTPEIRNVSKMHKQLDPQEATHGSILHCVELSRLRWHHAIRLSQKLDDLIASVIGHDSTSGFDIFVEKLFLIRADSALQFLDPLTYQWDASVGGDLAAFLQGGVIELIENECINKLNMVKQLIHEKLDVYRVREMRVSAMPRKPRK